MPSRYPGAGKKPKPATPVDVTPQVRVAKIEKRDILRTIGQPGFIHAYEQTAIYPKVAGYVLEWKVDIGKAIKKDEEIATLFVPELEAQLGQKKAQVELDEAAPGSFVGQRIVETALKTVTETEARAVQSKADVRRFQASVDRWESEVTRLTGLSGMGVVDKQVLEESKKQLKADTASRDAARAAVDAVSASVEARKSDVDKARADLVAARAKTQVSRKDQERLAALVAYTHIRAPYDGIVVVRNVNTGDFIQAAGGDQTVETVIPGTSTIRAPLYVVARTDMVRVYVDVPEMEASSINPKTEVRITVQALGDQEFSATVTRSSWSLHRETRTLRAEIDLPNPNAALLPNMYAYGRVQIDRHAVWAVPLSAVTEIGNHKCLYLLEDGKAMQTIVQAGINDGTWVEVARKRINGRWVDFTGNEQVALGDLAALTDGDAVKVIGDGLPPGEVKK